MNTLPLDKLGPGQSGRHAYLVYGKDGPVDNQNNIRHLSPDSPEIPGNGQHHPHVGGSPKEAIAVGFGAALCAAPPVTLVLLGVGVGVGAYWLLSRDRGTPSAPVEEAPVEAVESNELLDKLSKKFDERLERPGSIFYMSTEYPLSELLDYHFGRFKNLKDFDLFIRCEKRPKVLEMAELYKVLLAP